jgi:hypothetical protein
MRRLDWVLAAVIGAFLTGAFAMQAMGSAVASLDTGGNVLVERLVNPIADSPISAACPTISLRRR